MPNPFESAVEPVALPGHVVRLQPSGETRKIVAIEQLGKLGPYDFGAASADDYATESGSNIIDMDDELDMSSDDFGQFIVNPLSDVEIEVRQQGEQQQRFTTENQVGKITADLPPNQRVVFVDEEHSPHFRIKNLSESHDLSKTLVYFTGFKLVMGESVPEQKAASMRQGPATVPVGSLRVSVGGGAR